MTGHWNAGKLRPPTMGVLAICAWVLVWVTTAGGLAGCSSPFPSSPPVSTEGGTAGMPTIEPVALGTDEPLRVVASTSIVADVVQHVGGDLVALTVLVPPGSDPHAFQPTPQEMAAVSDAHVFFINGAGLETFVEDLLSSVGHETPVVPLSDGVELLRLESDATHEQAEERGELRFDPHTWFDPHNVMIWCDNIVTALSGLDPAHGEVYQTNAQAYRAELEDLDAWIRETVAQVPAQNRKLVTDHTAFSYFAHRYGFQQVGAIFPGYSTLSSPSAQDLAALEDEIRAYGVPAIFVGRTVNPDLAQRVAEDTGVRLVFLYTGSLSEPGGPADDYVALMRYDVSAITEALK